MKRIAKGAEYTDLRNSERFVTQHADTLRYVGAWKKWVAWDGARWVVDATGAAERAAKDTVRTMVVEAGADHTDGLKALERASEDEELVEVAKKRIANAKAPLDWAIESHSAARLRNIVQLARSAPELAVDHERLDADPWLLNVRNGTVDLRTGELRAHRRDDLITKLAPVSFDSHATCPTWEAFLHRAMAGHEDLIAFLRRIVGYAVTGVTKEHILVFLYGGGANGKSTFLTLIHTCLGDYATPAPRKLLFRARGERHPTEFATLFGARFVTCSEIADGQAFDEALVKDLTGGDLVECRRMKEDFWKFSPTHTLFIAGNHKPVVHGDDEGIWRRMRLIPFTVTIPEAERDKDLTAKLRDELPGILAWAVRGCIEWQQQGLAEPIAVKEATAEYRQESDATGEFLERYCVFEPEGRIARRRLREAYETWAKENGHAALGARRFAARLKEHGVGDANVREGMHVLDGWRGVRLQSHTERAGLRVVATEPVPTHEPALVNDEPVSSATARCRGVGTRGEQVPVVFKARGGAGETNRKSDLQVPTPLQSDEDEEEASSFTRYLASQGIV